jgi:uncharacterized membrane protein
MKKINYKKVCSVLLSFLVILPFITVFAQESAPTAAGKATINNPLAIYSFQALMLKLMDIVTVLGSIVVIFFIIYSGFKFVAARGNPGEIEKARNTFFATIIGAAILLGANVIAQVVVGTVESTTGLKIK